MSIKEKLYDFQSEDLEFLKSHPRVINGNAMGLGKTVEALALIEELDLQHVLVVCPKTLLSEWFWQSHVWLGDGCLTPHESSQYDHKLAGLDLKGPRIVAVNYDLLVNPKCWGALRSVKWDCIIFDEAHRLKNHKAKRTRATYLLTPTVPRIILMSGTPMQNGPQDLFPLFHILNPREYSSHNSWIDWFCVTELVKLHSGRAFNQIVGAKNQDKLRQLLSLYMVRHEKRDVLKDLPDKQHRIVPVTLGNEKKQYSQMEKELFALLDNGELITAPAVIAQLTRLRQICLDPNLLSSEPSKSSSPSNKTQTLLELIEGADGKVVVYTYFEQYTRLIAQELDKRSIKYVTITGQVSTQNRGRAVHAFQENSTQVCLGTIGAMGEGITLTAAHTVIFTDLFWNPAVNEQAEDRLHRIGQKDAVLVIDLFSPETVEEHVHKVVRRKQKMFNEIVTTKAIINSMRGQGQV